MLLSKVIQKKWWYLILSKLFCFSVNITNIYSKLLSKQYICSHVRWLGDEILEDITFDDYTKNTT